MFPISKHSFMHNTPRNAWTQNSVLSLSPVCFRPDSLFLFLSPCLFALYWQLLLSLLFCYSLSISYFPFFCAWSLIGLLSLIPFFVSYLSFALEHTHMRVRTHSHTHTHDSDHLDIGLWFCSGLWFVLRKTLPRFKLLSVHWGQELLPWTKCPLM